MAYVAVSGGKEAIEESIKLLDYYKSGTDKDIEIEAMENKLSLLIDRVMSEAGLYSKTYAALALKQCEGSIEEAFFLLRAYRSTFTRHYYTHTVNTGNMRIVRRISAAFKLGQGQYRSIAVYQATVAKYNGRHNGKEVHLLSIDELREYHANKPKLSLEQQRELVQLAHKKRIPVASHDDDTVEKLEKNLKIGVEISEFPISLETAKCAKAYGFYTVVGSANILRGSSHSGNLSAAEAVMEGCADIICSDYYPAAILHSIFHMNEKYGVSIPQMVRKTTLHPAQAMKIDKDYGSLDAGKKADVLIVDVLDGYPVVTHVFVDGIAALRIEYRR